MHLRTSQRRERSCDRAATDTTGALRQQLTGAMRQGAQESLRFELGAVDVELEVTVAAARGSRTRSIWSEGNWRVVGQERLDERTVRLRVGRADE